VSICARAASVAGDKPVVVPVMAQPFCVKPVAEALASHWFPSIFSAGPLKLMPR
jgi:hypothetical protein